MIVRFGRCRIIFGRYSQLQSSTPVMALHFLWFWFVKEVRPTDISKKQQFPLGTLMQYEGRKYYYYRAGKDIVCTGTAKEDE